MKPITILVLALIATSAFTQDNPNLEEGLKPFGSFQNGKVDAVNLTNGNLTVHIPLWSIPERGTLKQEFAVLYNGKAWDIALNCNASYCGPHWIFTGGSVGMRSSRGVVTDCAPSIKQGAPGGSVDCDMHTSDGAHHPVESGRAIDGSGLKFLVNSFYTDPSTNQVHVSTSSVDRDGNRFDNPFVFPIISEDPNLNRSTLAQAGNQTDTMNRNVPALQSSTDFTGCDGPSPTSRVAYWPLPGPGGSTSQIKICYTNYFIQSPFATNQVSGVTIASYSANWEMIQNVVLPDFSRWTFQYDSYGELTKLTLPTGGWIGYDWDSAALCSAYTQPNLVNVGVAPLSRVVTAQHVNANDGAGDRTWHYAYGSEFTINSDRARVITVTDPNGNQVQHTSRALGGSCAFYEVETKEFQGSSSTGQLLKDVQQEYSFSTNPDPPKTDPYAIANVLLTKVTTTLPLGSGSSKVNVVQRAYDAGFTYQNIYKTNTYNGTLGDVVDEKVFDFGVNAPGGLLSETVTDYKALHDSGYLNSNLVNLVTSKSVLNQSGIAASKVIYGYDEYPLLASGISTQHFGSSYWTVFNANVRGNQTSEQNWLASTNSYLVKVKKYYDTGVVASVTDPMGHATNYTYSGTYAGAYPTQKTNALSQSVVASYDFNTGRVTGLTDLNLNSSTFAYDNMLRITSASFPDGGSTTFAFPSANDVTRVQKLDATTSKTTKIKFDGLGREVRRITSNGQASAPWDQIDTCYGAVGLKTFASYPYQGAGYSSAARCSGIGDSYLYDALGRQTTITHSDSTATTLDYLGTTTRVNDEGNGTSRIQRLTQNDAVGRLISICESTSGTFIGLQGTPAGCLQDISATGFLTSYSYDPLGNLLQVAQGGLVPRTFTFDSLSRLISETSPEGGTWNYGYDNDGNLISVVRPSSNQTNPTVTTTETQQYDPLHRVTSKTFSDGTLSSTFNYDQNAALGVSLSNTIGRKSSEATSASAGSFASSALFSYDKMGRVVRNDQCFSPNCPGSLWPVSYTYDWQGNITSASNGVGHTFSYSYDGGGRQVGMISNLVDASNPRQIASAETYDAFGHLTSAFFGNGFQETRAYFDRGWLKNLKDGNIPAQTAASGAVAFYGASQGIQVPAHAASKSSAYVVISGTELIGTKFVCNKYFCDDTPDPDTGTFSITVNGVVITVASGNGSTASSLASAMASALNASSSSLVTATSSTVTSTSAKVQMTSRAAGAATNYPFSATTQSRMGSFANSAGDSLFVGGTDATTTPTTVADSGRIWVKVGTYKQTGSYTQGNSGFSFAAAMATAFNSDLASPVTAYVAQNSPCNGCPPPTDGGITLTSKIAGSSINYPLSSGSTSNLPQYFSPPAITTSNDPAVAGGTDRGTQFTPIYSLDLSYSGNGSVLTAADNVNGSWTYSYNDLEELLSASSPTVALAFDYDRYGNRWHQNVTAGSAPSSSLTFDNQNHIGAGNGVFYDAAGNVTSLTTGASAALKLDAEGRLIDFNSGATRYIYDAEGYRVQKISGTNISNFIHDLSGNVLAEIDGTGRVLREELYGNSRHLATYKNGTTYFSFADQVGSERVRVGVLGTVQKCTQLPFGDGLSCDNADMSPIHFSGKERDPESSLDYFGARYYSSSLARFMSTDPSQKSIDRTNPQTWNRYAFALNNPVRYLDQNGKWPTDIHDRIYATAFPGLTPSQIAAIQRGSGSVDQCVPCQSEALAYQHAMRGPKESIEHARAAMEKFVKQNESAARASEDFSTGSSHKAFSEDALQQFGVAAHPISDATSPAHEGFQIWRNPVEHPWDAHKHSEEESTITDQQMDEAVRAVRQAFSDTFGSAALQRAIDKKNEPVEERNQLYDQQQQKLYPEPPDNSINEHP